MRKNDNQIICSIDRQKDNRSFDQIPYNRIIYDMIFKEKEQKNKINIKPKEKYDLKVINLINLLKIDYQTTVSLDYFHRIINMKGKKINIRIWDTAGQERFNSITSGYLRGLHGCFVIFDVTERDIFEKLDMWVQFYNDFNQ